MNLLKFERDVVIKKNERRMFDYIFSFEGKIVHAILISCPHSDGKDFGFLRNSLDSIDSLERRTVFIEQGSIRTENNFYNDLMRSGSSDPMINAISYERLRDNELFSRKHDERLVFSDIADYILDRGGRVVNMDLADNSVMAAVEFLQEEGLSTQLIMEFFYFQLGYLFSKENIGAILRKTLPFDQQYMDRVIGYMNERCFDEDGVTSLSFLKRRLELIDYRDYLREKFMLRIMMKELRTGDIVIAHPEHISGILHKYQGKNETVLVPSSPLYEI